ncbi:protein tyrosine/serine phosphatase [Rhizobium rosettiformans]|uniref:Protein tyrosine/serine phosphatase n=1 Tax=Rhizobium rosettiformans TaxID=1368430 RepID=A0A7W8HRX7_9HYPH|nr:dual specificity protein phosphatase family protein [Rhizobium rosettiformans]MBB5277160.1 protein tyrosine/serine phosphatase [Rhizobium rosettiformans]
MDNIDKTHSAAAANAPKRSSWRVPVRRAFVTIAALALLFGAYVGLLILSGNFHEVLPGQFYRSAQLSGERLGAEIDRYGIKTVINLRGENPGKDWYDDEIAATAAHGARHVDFGMSARKDLTAERTQELLSILKTAEQPILVHCMSGADRTGLASVIFLQQVAGVDEEEAEWQLSPLYGHINLPFLAAYAMDDSWEALEKVIGLDS